MNIKLQYLFILFIGAIVASCGQNSDLKYREKVNSLYTCGYSPTELAFRLNCPVETIVDIMHNKEVSLDSKQANLLDSIYTLNNDSLLIPIHKLKLNQQELIYGLLSKTHTLPMMSYYSGVDPVSLVKALHSKQKLSYDDSIRVAISYINLKSNFTIVPNSFTNYKYYEYNDGIRNIKVVSPSYTQNKKYSEEELAKLDYYLWKAEQFEIKANEKLRGHINSTINKHIECAINDFIEDDLNSWTNIFNLVLTNDYITRKSNEQFNERLNIQGLSDSLKNVLISYCLSINCARAVLIDDVLGFPPIADNLSVSAKSQLKEFSIDAKKNISSFVDVQKEEMTTDLIKDILYSTISIGNILAIIDTIDDMLSDSMRKSDSLQIVLEQQLKNDFAKSVEEQMIINEKTPYYDMLDDDVYNYYNRIRRCVGIK